MATSRELFIWLLTQDVVKGWDVYTSAVVIASSEEKARKIHPSENARWGSKRWISTSNPREPYDVGRPSWPNPENVKAARIGVADVGTKPGLVLSSFAGS